MLRWTSLVNSRLPKGIRRKRRKYDGRTRRLTVETLEDRRLLATVDMVGNVLVFNNNGVEEGELVVFLSPTNSLTINAGTGVDDIDLLGVDTASTLDLIVNGDDASDNIDGSAITVGLFNSVTLNGNDGDDDIFVTPSATGSTTVDGGPNAASGDVLSIDLTGTSGAMLNIIGPGAGQITFTSGEVPIDFFDIEMVEATGGTLATGAINTGAGNDMINVSAEGADLVVRINSAELVRTPLALFNGPLIINGQAGDDDLTVDFTGGDPIPAGGIQFNGGTHASVAGDSISIVGTFTNQTLNYNAPGVDGNNGDLILDGATITYTGLEPINAGDAANTILNLPLGSVNNATLQNSASAGEIEIVDNGATFENTIIPNPTGSLTVNLGDQGDILQVGPLDAAFAASLAINGEAGDDILTIDFTGGPVVPTGGLTFNGGAQANGDRIVLQGGGLFNSVAHTFTNENDGTIAISTENLITYTGLEPVIDNLNAVNRVFTFTGGAETINLSEDAGINDNISIVDSTLGESVAFVHPTNSLTINAGTGVDQVNLVSLDPATTFDLTVNGDSENDIINVSALASAALATIALNGGAGNDTFTVVPGLAVTTVNGNVPIVGDPGVPPGDRLVLALPNGVTLDNNPTLPDGTAMLTGATDVMFTSIEQFIAISPDALENNNTLATASVLGSPPFVTLNNLSIHQADDVDFFKYTAHETGRLVVRALFDHTIGDLNLEIQDLLGNVIATPLVPSAAGINQEEIIIPVVGQEMYFVGVFGVGGAVNNYSLEIENFAVPIPTGIHLDPASDLGRLNNDELTSDDTPTLIIQTDVLGFVDANRNNVADVGEIDVLTAAEAAAGNVPGIAVEVTLINTTDLAQAPIVAFTDPLIPTFPTVYTFTPAVPLPDGVYFATARTVVIDGQTPNELGRSGVSDPLWFTIDTLKSNVFFGNAAVANDGLDPASDSGVVSQTGTFVDRVTNDTTPTFFGTSEANATVRVFVRNSAGARELIGETVATPFNGNNPLASGRWTLTSMIDMNNPLLGFAALDGLRQFEVEAEDVAGNLSQGVGFELAAVPQNINDNTATSFTITVSSFIGPITDLDVGLDLTHANLAELTATLMSPNGTIVQLFSGLAGANLIGTVLDDEAAVAITTGIAPFTGTFQPTGTLADFDAENPIGDWTLTITDNAAGNVGALDGWSLWFQSNLDIFIDTQGPRVTNVFIPDNPATAANEADFNLFAPKPTEGPTPLVNQLNIAFSDLPNRVAAFAYDALVNDIATNPGNYQLVGDQVGNVAIQSVAVTASSVAIGSPAASTLTLTFAQPLADDRYMLIISDNLVDPAGNKLDGESQFASPAGGTFPSGDGVPGGDFVARLFAIDTRPEIGTWLAGTVLVDTNGNFLFDPTNADASNRDIAYRIGFGSDNIFAGNFAGPGPDSIFGTVDDTTVPAGDGVADGFDKLAAYGRVGGVYRWLIDTDNNGVPNFNLPDPAGINGYPVAGNFDGNAANGDEVGLFTGSAWVLDTTHNFNVNATTSTNYTGFPFVGDFDGDGDDDGGTYVASSAGGNLFTIDLDINGTADFSFQVGSPGTGGFGFAGTRERPVAADFNADGIDDFGLWIPDGIVPVPDELSEWYLLLSGDDPFTGIVETTVLDRIQDGPLNGFVPFSPEPFGNDLYAQFGNTFALPIVGNFDPPVAGAASTFATPPPTLSPAPTTETIAAQTTSPNSALGSPPTSIPTTTTTAEETVPEVATETNPVELPKPDQSAPGPQAVAKTEDPVDQSVAPLVLPSEAKEDETPPVASRAVETEQAGEVSAPEAETDTSAAPKKAAVAKPTSGFSRASWWGGWAPRKTVAPQVAQPAAKVVKPKVTLQSAPTVAPKAIDQPTKDVAPKVISQSAKDLAPPATPLPAAKPKTKAALPKSLTTTTRVVTATDPIGFSRVTVVAPPQKQQAPPRRAVTFSRLPTSPASKRVVRESTVSKSALVDAAIAWELATGAGGEEESAAVLHLPSPEVATDVAFASNSNAPAASQSAPEHASAALASEAQHGNIEASIDAAFEQAFN